MEPRREEPKVPKAGIEERKKRFRIVKLEERIAPGNGHANGSNPSQCHHSGCLACVSGPGCVTYSIE
jgi:hypothetical protein